MLIKKIDCYSITLKYILAIMQQLITHYYKTSDKSYVLELYKRFYNIVKSNFNNNNITMPKYKQTVITDYYPILPKKSILYKKYRQPLITEFYH